MRVGTAGLLGTSRRGLLGTMKGHIKEGGDSARGAFSTKTSFRHYFAMLFFYNISIPRERKFNSDSN